MAKNSISSKQEEASVAETRKAQIIAAAIKLFSERGYFQTKIEDIAKAIDVSKGLIYLYFKDKNDVLFNVHLAVLGTYRRNKVLSLLPMLGPLGTLRRVLELNCIMAEEYTQACNLAYHSTKDLAPKERRQVMAIETEIAKEIEQCLQAAIDAGLMHPLDIHFMAYQYVMLGHTWALKHWTLRKHYTMREYLAQGEELLILPHLTAAGRRKFKAEAPSYNATAKPAAQRIPTHPAKRKTA